MESEIYEALVDLKLAIDLHAILQEETNTLLRGLIGALGQATADRGFNSLSSGW